MEREKFQDLLQLTESLDRADMATLDRSRIIQAFLDDREEGIILCNNIGEIVCVNEPASRWLQPFSVIHEESDYRRILLGAFRDEKGIRYTSATFPLFAVQYGHPYPMQKAMILQADQEPPLQVFILAKPLYHENQVIGSMMTILQQRPYRSL